MLRKSLAIGASVVLTLGLSTTAASAAHRTAVKAGAACTKVGATATISGAKYVCTKKGTKRIWVKKAAVSKDCLNARKTYVTAQATYAKALADLATLKVQVAAIPGPSGDTLRSQLTILEPQINIAGTLVKSAKDTADMICAS